MTDRPFAQVDVFTEHAGFGNPVAVVLDGAGLRDEDMLRFARWTNLSETTFVLPPTDPTADYAVRIFTPGGELPFAGHPTLGTCYAWLVAGGRPRDPYRVVQQCAKGLVPICRDGARLAFATPPMQASEPPPDLVNDIAQSLGLPDSGHVLKARILDNGLAWFGVLLPSADAVVALEPDHARLAQLGVKVGVVGFHQDVAVNQPLIEVRGFVSPLGVPEDPVTGSLNACLAEWLIADGDLPDAYVAAQGQRLGRAGRVYVHRDDEALWIGGHCIRVISGIVTV